MPFLGRINPPLTLRDSAARGSRVDSPSGGHRSRNESPAAAAQRAGPLVPDRGRKTLAQQGFRDQGPVRCMAVLAIEQFQHEWAQEHRAGGGVLRLFRGSSGSCAAAIGHDLLYH